jgi:hypothetical protein
MNPTTQKDMITNALLMGAIFAIIMYLWTRDPVQAGVMAVIMSFTMYTGYWASNRVAVQIAKRVRPPEPPSAPLEATTDRPEHVQRRRSRRRPRGRRHPD